MKSKIDLASSPRPLRETKRSTSPTSAMLTPSELESLTQKANENDAYFKKAFSHLRPKAKSKAS